MADELTNLVVLDYSGTLTLGTVLFGKSHTLAGALQQSGLRDLGVENETIFWNHIVNPTWAEGSRTQIGYKALIVKQLEAMTGRTSNQETQAVLQASAAQFVDDYFARGTIDVGWKDIFTTLQTSETLTIIATDNYAEATGHVIAHLQLLGITCHSALAAVEVHKSEVLVANSADYGYYKADPAFWKKLKAQFGLSDFSVVLVVDDFGFNEVVSDSYAKPEKVQKRSLEMSEALSSVFNRVPASFDFFVQILRDAAALDESAYLMEYKGKIEEVGNFIRNHLDKNKDILPRNYSSCFRKTLLHSSFCKSRFQETFSRDNQRTSGWISRFTD
jgi:hypothetical protein